MGSALEAAGLVHCGTAALDFVGAVLLAEVTHVPLESGILETFSLWSPCPGSISPCFQGVGGYPFQVGSVGCPMCPFLETLSAPPSCSGHSGSGKTEAAKTIVRFLSGLEQEPARDRRRQVRGSWTFPRDPGGTILLWARRAVSRPLAPPWGQPQSLPTVGQGGGWDCHPPWMCTKCPQLGCLSVHSTAVPGILECPSPHSWRGCSSCSAALATPRPSSMPTPAASARPTASACSSE